MDAFSYLSVLLSIIIGLAITQVLEGYRAILLARRRVVLDAPSLIWSVLLIFFATQSWWASFGLREHSDWKFLSFCVVLLQMILLYMMSAVVLPDVAEGGTIDLRAHFDEHRRLFFGFLFALLVTSILKDLVLSGALPGPANLFFHGLLAATAVVGGLVTHRRAQLALALCAAIGFTAYIVSLFARL